jgi:hypothetical protein
LTEHAVGPLHLITAAQQFIGNHPELLDKAKSAGQTVLGVAKKEGARIVIGTVAAIGAAYTGKRVYDFMKHEHEKQQQGSEIDTPEE